MRISNLVFAASLSACGAGTARATTLDDSAAMALAASPGLGAVRADYLASTARIAIAATDGRPRLNFSSTISHDFDNDPYVPRLRDETGIRLDLPLYSGGRVHQATAAARLRQSAAGHDLAARSDDIVISVAQEYDRVLDAGDAVSLAHDEVGALEHHVAMIDSQRLGGLATRTDAAQGGARLAAARATLETALGRLEQARASYHRVVGVEPEGLVSPTPPQVAGAIDRLTDDALHYSPSLRAMQERIEAAARDVRATRALGLPTLSLTGNASYGNTDMQLAQTRRFPHRLFGQIGLTLTVPLYRGGQIRAQTDRAAALLDRARADAEQERRLLIDQVRSGYHAYQGALRGAQAAEAANEAARRSLDGVRIELEAGTRTALDLLNAQREVSASARAAATARREAHLEAIALLVRTGAYLNRETTRTPPAPPASAMPAKPVTAVTRVDFDLARLPGSVATPARARIAAAGPVDPRAGRDG